MREILNYMCCRIYTLKPEETESFICLGGISRQSEPVFSVGFTDQYSCHTTLALSLLLRHLKKRSMHSICTVIVFLLNNKLLLLEVESHRNNKKVKKVI